MFSNRLLKYSILLFCLSANPVYAENNSVTTAEVADKAKALKKAYKIARQLCKDRKPADLKKRERRVSGLPFFISEILALISVTNTSTPMESDALHLAEELLWQTCVDREVGWLLEDEDRKKKAEENFEKAKDLVDKVGKWQQTNADTDVDNIRSALRIARKALEAAREEMKKHLPH